MHGAPKRSERSDDGRRPTDAAQESMSGAEAWGRIEARSYEEAAELLEKLSHHPAALVEEAERRWSIYISGDADELPKVIRGVGLDPKRIELVEDPERFASAAGGEEHRAQAD